MKIKQKKQLNLPQLIEWGFEQKELPPLFYGSREGSLVQFTPGGWVNITGIEPTDTFTVEVEETVTEKTEFELLIEITDGYPNFLWEEASVEDWKDEDSKEFHAYIDREFKCIWRDGKLVD
ncbi:hypothetical protein ABLV98_00680 [Staphylococcus sp. 50Mo3-1]|uniref:hypothetical protein n=1 Tax=Staphylococcus sp. 50Mo3-2 TaxID=3135642 RepID=UPI0033EA3E8B